MSSTETTVMATGITQQPAWENDTEVSVRVMRSCVFLFLRQRHGPVIAHVDISREDWQRLASSPPPQDEPDDDRDDIADDAQLSRTESSACDR